MMAPWRRPHQRPRLNRMSIDSRNAVSVPIDPRASVMICVYAPDTLVGAPPPPPGGPCAM